MYHVKVKKQGEKITRFLSSGSSLNRLRIHAVEFGSKERAQAIADEITANNPEYSATVAPVSKPTVEDKIKELEATIAAQEISEANGATAQHDEQGKVIERITTCGTCGKSWNDALITGRTPAPSARCPYEGIHQEIAALKRLRRKRPLKAAAVIAVFVVLAGTIHAAERKYYCKASHLGAGAVAVSCMNGADPTVAGRVADSLIVSCGTK